MSGADWRDSLKSLLPDDYAPEPAQALEPKPAPMPRLKIEVDRKRKGKVATIILGFDADDERCADLCAWLKKKLATGGSHRDGEILMQGDCSGRLPALINEYASKTNGR